MWRIYQEILQMGINKSPPVWALTDRALRSWDSHPGLFVLIPLVNGEFAPVESCPELAAGVPDRSPGAKNQLV